MLRKFRLASFILLAVATHRLRQLQTTLRLLEHELKDLQQ